MLKLCYHSTSESNKNTLKTRLLKPFRNRTRAVNHNFFKLRKFVKLQIVVCNISKIKDANVSKFGRVKK